MYNFLSKKGLSIAFIVGIGTTVITMAVALMGMSADINSEMFQGLSPAEAQAKTKSVTNFDLIFYATYVLLAISVIAAVVMPIVFIITNPGKSLISGLIFVGSLAVILVICYFMAADVQDTYGVRLAMEQFAVTPGQSQLISGCINGSIVLLFISLIALFVGELINLFR